MTKTTCLTCCHFQSFRAAYDDDSLEPDDQGFCHHPHATEEMEETAGVYAQGCSKWEAGAP